ncbi:RNA-binding protein 25 isoform X3 [Cynara cardunculus var. scolymus]|uniref:RNA-binding protein 25 isoform X3 n=1 Tax=Cynara cardunculus var. scolymus TaxID=59895 RepID=UPI000D623E66|nr:RNA-binding protein 25 isoform X3 [Cynara cardunculus var. scolymus]
MPRPLLFRMHEVICSAGVPMLPSLIACNIWYFFLIHAGILRYAPPPYPSMLRPAYPQRPLGAVGVIPALPRPPMMPMRGPVVPTIVRPAINPTITPTEKPMNMVYVGKIASTVDNDFMLSLLQLCGPVKSWKRVQDTGGFKGFGFCEFESPEGVLRALRMLNKLSIDGQELMLNFDHATRKYLKLYVEKKKDNFKNLKATDTEGSGKGEGNASGLEKNEPSESSVEESKDISKEEKKEDDNNESNKEIKDIATFGLVTNEDKEADREASEKITGMIEERIKNKPLPPPPSPPQTAPDVPGNSTSEHPARSRDGDSDVDITRTVEDRNGEEMTSKSKPSGENERPETSSPDRSNKNDRRSKDRERDLKREKERELERYEREREQERAKREREREYKIREDERRYRARLKEWESREKEKERARKQEREREKDREQDRKYEILDQENDDGYSKKRKYRSSGEEREERKRRLREKEEDMDDRIKEEEEIAEAKRKAEEEREQQKEQQKHALELLSSNATNGAENAMLIDGGLLDIRNKAVDQTTDGEVAHGNEIDSRIIQNGTGDDSAVGSAAASEMRQSNTVTTKKLGFGLVGSGKRTTVPSLFHEEEDEDAQKDKKMRPLVPIDYTTEELQAVQDTAPVAPSPLAAAAEFAKRIGNANSKEERPDSERERSRRSHDRSSHRDRDRNFEEANRSRDETRKEPIERERGSEKAKTPDNKKLLDAKQLIDTIPKTKDELFSYPINWATYDKNGLHERMRPWISKKITEFLGEEETTLVDYIVSSTQEHVTADEMLDRLQSILDDEAEMFVLKMWRMLIFEIKKVETGLAGRSKT